uniref:Uncharacterized protein n=1 Tax=viral metagenome TaxID=1070528 RepID=A0A6M3XPX8_9ZZZZ
MNRSELIAQLHLSIQDERHDIYEKMFCVALLGEGTDVTARVLKSYNEMKDVLQGGRDEPSQTSP